MRRLLAPLMTILLLGYLIIPKLDVQKMPFSLLSADAPMTGSNDMGMTYQMLVENALAFQNFTKSNPQSQLTTEASQYLDTIRAHIQQLPDLKLFEFFPIMEWLQPDHGQEGIIVTALIYLQENPEFITDEAKNILTQTESTYSTALQSIINQTISLGSNEMEH